MGNWQKFLGAARIKSTEYMAYRLYSLIFRYSVLSPMPKIFAAFSRLPFVLANVSVMGNTMFPEHPKKILKKGLTYAADYSNYLVLRLQKLVMWQEIIWKSSKIRQTRNSTACCRQELTYTL